MSSKRSRTISFTAVTVIFAIILFSVFFCMSFISAKVNLQYGSVSESINAFVVCERSSECIKDTANYLTEQAQLFIMTHDEKYARSYLEEKFIKKSQDGAVRALLDQTSSEDPKYRRLEIALNQSDSLANIELYGMRLAYEAAEIENLPEQFAEIEIRPNDLRESADEYQLLAENTIYGDGYLIYKNRVNQNCLVIVTEIENDIQNELEKNKLELNVLLKFSYGLQIIIVVFSVLFFVAIAFFVLRPLKSFILSIRKKERLGVIGAKEFQYLAETYNEVHEFDVLTKILNRRAFSELCHRFKMERCSLALIFVDIDDFKGINDKYGHSKGDFVLQSIAGYLNLAFRKNDYVARIGGDEFAILIPNFAKNNFSLLEQKINEVNNELEKNPELGGVSLSAGIAFSTDGYNRDLYEAADKALYTAKENGKHRVFVAM